MRDRDRNRAIHPSAVVSASAKLARTWLSPASNLGEKVTVDDETTIGPGAVIEDNAVIGNHCRIDANVTIYEGTTSETAWSCKRRGAGEKASATCAMRNRALRAIPTNRTPDHRRRRGNRSQLHRRSWSVGRNQNPPRRKDRTWSTSHNCQIGENVIIAAQTDSPAADHRRRRNHGRQVGIGRSRPRRSRAMIGGQGGILPKKILREKGCFLGNACSSGPRVS